MEKLYKLQYLKSELYATSGYLVPTLLVRDILEDDLEIKNWKRHINYDENNMDMDMYDFEDSLMDCMFNIKLKDIKKISPKLYHKYYINKEFKSSLT